MKNPIGNRFIYLALVGIGISAPSPRSFAQRAGTVVVWGTNGNGQTNVPAAVSNIVAISGAWEFMYALRSNGDLVRWGVDLQGHPLVSFPLTNVLAISAGSAYSDGHATALLRDRT